MTTRAELLALAARCEAATGPDRELDAEIAVTVDGGEIVWRASAPTMEMRPARRYASHNHVGGYGNAPIPAFTASLDAALTLVPEGWGWQIRRSHTGQWAACYLWSGTGAWSSTAASVVATPALALTAAALRAKAEEMPE